nr:hypothetical protein [uncultured Ruegeria sp.]
MTISEKNRRYHVPLVLIALSALTAGPAWANVPMAPFFALIKVSLWWVILLALLIETVALQYLFRMEWKLAAKAALAINVISLFCGLVLYPLMAVLGYALLEDMIVDLFGSSGFVEISALWIGASIVDSGVELCALKLFFSRRSSLSQGFGFLIANLASAGVLVGVMAFEAHVPVMPAEETSRIEAEFAPEIAFMKKTLHAFPSHIVVNQPSAGFRLPDRDWTDGLLTELETLRIRTIALSVPPATVWTKGSTALWDVDARFKDGETTIEKGFVDTVYVRRQPHPTGLWHYRYRIELDLDGAIYAIEAVLRN